MKYTEILVESSKIISSIIGRQIPVIEISKPTSLDYARQLTKVISKLSPLLGNMIEYSIIDTLNKQEWNVEGIWERQDPGFPDAIFKSSAVIPNPGIEIKTWFPLATEITARFKDSVVHFVDNQINVAVIAWLPEFIIWGKPIIIDTWIGSASSVANARDKHYHNPPDYLVFEPEDTSARTINLQQTNTSGYKFQGTSEDFQRALIVVSDWGLDHREYSTDIEYQSKLKSLLGNFSYRLDTNFAKMDRIQLASLEAFKTKVLNTIYKGKTIKTWSQIMCTQNYDLDNALAELLQE